MDSSLSTNTMLKIGIGHRGYIYALAVAAHSKSPLLLSASGDATIKVKHNVSD
jgi:hypothetical protein